MLNFNSFDLQAFLHQATLIAPGMLFALTIHEFAHGYVSYRLGDPTAKMLGRLTMNPLKHLDLIGTLVFLITGLIGWAKPVPINPRYYKDFRHGILYVALAGPIANIIGAIFSFILAFSFSKLIGSNTFDEQSLSFVFMNIFLFSIQINIILAIFNMFPIPPLDGSRVLAFFLPPKQRIAYEQLGKYALLILLPFLYFGIIGTLLNSILEPIMHIVFTLLR